MTVDANGNLAGRSLASLGGSGGGGSDDTTITVLAASSLTGTFTQLNPAIKPTGLRPI